MTSKELAKRLGKSECTIVSHFARTKRSLEKVGIIIDKVRGKDEYSLTYRDLEDNNDSATIE